MKNICIYIYMYVFIPDYICTCLRIPLPKTSNSKTQAVAVDAKSPKHHLDMSRKRPKPEPKNCFTLPLESTKTLFWASRNLALEHRFRKPRTAKHKPESLEQQNTSGSLRSEKSQTPGHEPKTAKTRSKKSCTLPLESKNNSCGPQEHMPSRGKTVTTLRKSRLEAQLPSIKLLTARKQHPETRCKTVAKSSHRTPLPKASNSKTQAVAVDAKSPKHHLDTSRKRPKPEPKNPVAKSGLRTPLPKASNSKTQAVALDAKSPKHLDTSRKRPKPDQKNLARYLWNPKIILVGRKSTCPVAEKR